MEKPKQSTTVVLAPYDNFLYALKTVETKRQYSHRLDNFLSFIGLQGKTIPEKCDKLFQFSKESDLESYLIAFINFQKIRVENKTIAEGTLRNYVKAIKLFCSMNDIVVNWKKISKGMPSVTNFADDRIPTMGEIQKLVEHEDRRIRAIVSVMISSGIRVGSWDYLQWKHVIPIERDGLTVAAKLIVVNTKIRNRKYYSFLTPETYQTLKSWMDFRQLHGEKITGDSFLMRDTWQKIDKNHAHRIGAAYIPRKLSSSAIRNMIYEAWKVQGVRNYHSDPLTKRHEFKSTHSFRKFFETKCQKAKMNHNNIKLLMDHSLGESQNYHRPTEEDLLDDYMNAIDLLTINEENRLRRKISEYAGRDDAYSLELTEKIIKHLEKRGLKL